MRDKIEAIEYMLLVHAKGISMAAGKDLSMVIASALMACDEVCVWRKHAFGSRVSGCANIAYVGNDKWTYCPHCGRKIKEQP